MQVQAEEVKKKPNQTKPTQPNKLFMISQTHPCVLHRYSQKKLCGQSFWLFTLGAAQGRGGSCSLHWLLAIKQTEQKEFHSKWEAGMWHQEARFRLVS